MAIFIVELTGPMAWQLAAYLEAGRRELSGRDGLPTPEVVAAFTKGMSTFAARECPDVPTVDDIAVLLDARRMEPVLVSIAEAARVMGVGRRTMARLVASGEVPSVKLGDRRLVRWADLQRFAAALVPAPLAERMEVK